MARTAHSDPAIAPVCLRADVRPRGDTKSDPEQQHFPALRSFAAVRSHRGSPQTPSHCAVGGQRKGPISRFIGDWKALEPMADGIGTRDGRAERGLGAGGPGSGDIVEDLLLMMAAVSIPWDQSGATPPATVPVPALTSTRARPYASGCPRALAYPNSQGCRVYAVPFRHSGCAAYAYLPAEHGAYRPPTRRSEVRSEDLRYGC